MRQEGEQLSNNIIGTVTDLNKTHSTEGLGVLFVCLLLPTAIKEGLLEEVKFELAHEGDRCTRAGTRLFVFYSRASNRPWLIVGAQ